MNYGVEFGSFIDDDSSAACMHILIMHFKPIHTGTVRRFLGQELELA